MSNKKNKSDKQKQYTTLRILTSTHQRIKEKAEAEQRTIDVVVNRLLDSALAKESNSELLSQPSH